MPKKKLGAYHPDAYRNRLASPTVVMPYKNSSQIVIGDRSSYYSRQFVTTNNNVFTAPKQEICSNTGIQAEATKRKKNSQAQ